MNTFLSVKIERSTNRISAPLSIALLIASTGYSPYIYEFTIVDQSSSCIFKFGKLASISAFNSSAFCEVSFFNLSDVHFA